jgi:hypothetical protein
MLQLRTGRCAVNNVTDLKEKLIAVLQHNTYYSIATFVSDLVAAV